MTEPVDLSGVLAALDALVMQVDLLRKDLRSHADVKGLDVMVVVEALIRIEAQQARGYQAEIGGEVVTFRPVP